MEKIILEIPKEDIEEVVHLLRYAMGKEPTSNDVWSLLAPFCEKHSSDKFYGKEEELLTYSKVSDITDIHTPEREKELQELCEQVLNASPERYYNPNGADETTCPFCYGVDYSNHCSADISDIKHDINCAYNIALGLSTNR